MLIRQQSSKKPSTSRVATVNKIQLCMKGIQTNERYESVLVSQAVDYDAKLQLVSMYSISITSKIKNIVGNSLPQTLNKMTRQSGKLIIAPVEQIITLSVHYCTHKKGKIDTFTLISLL